LKLISILENDGWLIISKCLQREKGTDIIAQLGEQKLLIEVKGAKSGADKPIRKEFDSGQIKTHFGKAVIKAMEMKRDNPNSRIMIAHPNDSDIKKHIESLLPLLTKMDIEHYWVNF
jgi:hypothetical protein